MRYSDKKIFNKKTQESLRRKLRRSRPYSERLLWMKIRNSQLGFKFRRQHGVGEYVVDFYCPEIKLVVEIDGATHGTEEELEKDSIREVFLKSLGLIVKRYYNKDVKENIDTVLDDLLIYCRSLKSSPT